MASNDPRDYLKQKDVANSVSALSNIGSANIDSKNNGLNLGGDVNRVGEYDPFKGLGATQAKSSVSSALTGLQQQASGVDNTLDRVESQTLKGLQAQQGSQQQALGNIGAQQGLSASQTALQGIMMNRQQESAQADVRGTLATQRSERQRTAVGQLGQLGLQANANEMQEKGMEISDEQFKLSTQLQEDQLNQERKIAREQLKASSERDKVTALMAVADIVAKDVQIKKSYLDMDTQKMAIYDNMLGNMDPSSDEFSSDAKNGFAVVYGYESYDDMKQKADGGDTQATKDLAMYNSKDYQQLKNDSHKENADVYFGELGAVFETIPTDELTGTDGSYNVFTESDGAFKLPEDAVVPASELYWNTMMGTVRDTDGDVYESKQDFIEDVRNGKVSDKFKNYTNDQVKAQFQSDKQKNYEMTVAGIDNDKNLTDEEKADAKEMAKDSIYNGVPEGGFTDTIRGPDGKMYTIKYDARGEIISSGGLKTVDGQIEGVIDYNGEDILPDSDGFYSLGNSHIDEGDGTFAWDSLDEYFETDGSKGDLENVGYKFTKDSNGEMSVELSNGENVTVKDIRNLPGYDSAKSSLDGIDPEDPSNASEKTSGNQKMIDGVKVTNTGTQFDMDIASEVDILNQLKVGNSHVMGKIKSEYMNDGGDISDEQKSLLNVIWKNDELKADFLSDIDGVSSDTVSDKWDNGLFKDRYKKFPENSFTKNSIVTYNGEPYRIDSDKPSPYGIKTNGYKAYGEYVTVTNILTGKSEYLRTNTADGNHTGISIGDISETWL
jgi:hypothetical protein